MRSSLILSRRRADFDLINLVLLHAVNYVEHLFIRSNLLVQF